MAEADDTGSGLGSGMVPGMAPGASARPEGRDPTRDGGQEGGRDGRRDAEGALLVAYANGDRAAAQALTEALAPRAFAQAARMLGSRAEAEEVAQEAMLRLWRAAADWRQGEARVSTWLYRVTANLCTDRLRRRTAGGRGVVGIDEVAEPPDPSPSAAERLQGEARLRALSEALAALPARQAQAVALRHLEGLTNPEIAAVMEVGVEAVESLTARGKRALAAALRGRKAELGYDD
jgi:RNA polymerase sigma-70 factor (ECF subfamily)